MQVRILSDAPLKENKMKLLTTALVALILIAAPSYASTMKASWYDCAKPGECSKRKITASGEKFNPNALTAAHKTLPFGTLLRVTHKGKSVIVRINDRGPFIKGRHLDLSRAAARKIGCGGVCTVKVEVIGKKKKKR
jgi:rare lipoprotein A